MQPVSGTAPVALQKIKTQIVTAFQKQTGVHFLPARWREFITDNGLAKVGLHQYYLGAEKEKMLEEDYAYLLTELFTDAVKVGALTLPGDYEAEDFQIQIHQDLGSLTDFIGHAYITLKEKEGPKGAFAFNPSRLRRRATLSRWRDRGIEHTITSVAVGVMDLLNHSKA